MELNQVEISTVSEAIKEGTSAIELLSDLQLAIVGGGIGETVL